MYILKMQHTVFMVVIWLKLFQLSQIQQVLRSKFWYKTQIARKIQIMTEMALNFAKPVIESSVYMYGTG